MTATATYLTLRALLDEFARCGMQMACASPGSRNTPILLSLAAERRIHTVSQIDERAAGFFALGAAKASGLPVAVTCTSGTAAANLLPAVIEAHEAGVPLIILTADRPPELRDIGAGQTIDQIKLYGDAVKWFCEVGVPEADAERLRWTRSLACRAYWTAVGEFPGPVHLNLPLREPLVLDRELPKREPGGGGRANGQPWVAKQRTAGHTTGQIERATLVAPRAVVVAGELPAGQDFGHRLASLCEHLQLPLLADPRSGARRGDAAIVHYDLLLRDQEVAKTLTPEVVYRIGDLPTSKPLRTWLAQIPSARQIALTTDTRWLDPSSVVRERWSGTPSGLLAQLTAAAAGAMPDRWFASWRDFDRAIEAAISEPLATSGLSEPAVAAELSRQLTANQTLFVAASMPIRDIEMLFEAQGDQPRVLANRGANGIDGTISSALGVAAAGNEVVLLCGDVTLAHDLGGLLAARRGGLKLTIVLLNNEGGGIFDFLPVSQAAPSDVFEALVATPPGISFEQVASLFGLRHTRPTTLKAFDIALDSALSGTASTIIEVRGDRAKNLALHRAIEAAARGALRSAVSIVDAGGS